MELNSSVKEIVAKNLAELRQSRGYTQLELAESLNYSDKAVSKWERGESLPDIEVLVRLADLYEVNLDYLVTRDHKAYVNTKEERRRRARKNYHTIIAMSVLLVWLIASMTFVILNSVLGGNPAFFLCFLYAVPISCIVMLVLNSVWFEGRKNVYIISVLMWSCLAALYVTLKISVDRPLPLIFILGIPGQLIISLWCTLSNPATITANRFENK